MGFYLKLGVCCILLLLPRRVFSIGNIQSDKLASYEEDYLDISITQTQARAMRLAPIFLKSFEENHCFHFLRTTNPNIVNTFFAERFKQVE
ncbi:MAG: hypothetical protein GVY20_15840 [Bacteroidetes bacterium]|nr:hypothetical protein [Bacteroidota bacterium]